MSDDDVVDAFDYIVCKGIILMMVTGLVEIQQLAYNSKKGWDEFNLATCRDRA